MLEDEIHKICIIPGVKVNEIQPSVKQLSCIQL